VCPTIEASRASKDAGCHPLIHNPTIEIFFEDVDGLAELLAASL
jgi:hypothetical protein